MSLVLIIVFLVDSQSEIKNIYFLSNYEFSLKVFSVGNISQ